MIRQRVCMRGAGLSGLVLSLLVTVFAFALVFYGVMVVLAALKLNPDTINSISAYRTIDHSLGAITAADITGRDRVIVAVAGVVCLLVFAPLAWRALPRPYLARADVDLADDSGPGRTEIGPRALERAAELASIRDPRIDRARARSGTALLDVQVTLVAGEESMRSTLREVQQRVRTALDEQGLPAITVDVTLAGAPSSRPVKENHR